MQDIHLFAFVFRHDALDGFNDDSEQDNNGYVHDWKLAWLSFEIFVKIRISNDTKNIETDNGNRWMKCK